MRPDTFLLPNILLLVFALLGSSPTVSQTAVEGDADEAAGGEVFFEVVDVEIVNIDVWVTDKKGAPVEGLAKNDFVVYRDGKPVEVANFYAVSGGRSVPPPSESTDPADDRAAGATSPAAPSDPADEAPSIEPEHRLWLIVYVDNYNIDPPERNRILPSLQRFLTLSLQPGDQAMVVSYNRSLKVVQPFTDELPLLASSLADLRDDAGQGVVRRRDLIATIKRIDETDSASQALVYARQYAEEQMNSVGFTVDALQRFIDSLAGLPGRKALVYVSSGLPMLAGEAGFHAVAEKFGTSRPYAEIPRHDASRRFEAVNRHANAHRVVFHTLDAGGLRGIEFGSAEYGGFVSPNLRRTLDSVVPENLQSPLRLMALETGGQMILNQNQVLPALEEVAKDFRSFYSLGISSIGGDTGAYHEIEVKLRERRRGLHLRHRAGYRSKTLQSRIEEGLRSALLYSHQKNPLGLQVQWGRPEPSGTGGRYLMPIRLKIPLRDLVLLPVGAGKHEVRLKLFVGAVGKDGEASEIDEAPLGLRLADEHVEAARGESFVHTHKLLLSRGRKKVGVAVLDVFGRQSSVVTAYVDVGAPIEPGQKLKLDLNGKKRR